ncbi:DNA polymerase III subunit beta [Candidatus Protochlamydia naegleriophila]|uniref:Beta sliding clamp n=1 Tax=Candidatus Protochlamydia naegleriophila TaxID=389348 RepID=A0A0U5JBQ0_9BACT|nr:DNA polymerase III subunit beta [Candidatus Protochlamydia naegleriophila]CUI16551.1 DNA polymerase III subunit beta [Candidatus Protochlamydia naegleriophila]
MKFVISTQELNYLISKILNVVSQKPTIPILSNFLLEAYNDELILTATDLTVGIRCHTEAKILEEGATTLPAKRLAQLIRELTAVNVEVSTNSNEVTTIVAGTSRFKLNGMSKTEYPALPDLSQAHTFHMKQSELKDLLYRTSFAVSKEDNRYVLTGVLMQIANGMATFVGTDGKRLARSHGPIDIGSSFTGQSIIPLKAVDEILKNLSDEGDVKISLMSDKIAVEANQIRLLTKLLAGDYPDVNRVIPERSDIIVSLHREELSSLLRQISLFTADHNHSVRFTFSQGELKLTANTMDIGEGNVTMPANYQGSKLEIAFNPGFFIDILRHCKGETVTMGLTDAYNPGIITDGDQLSTPLQASPLFVIMPMRLSED